MIAKQMLWNVERSWKARRMGIHIQYGLEDSHQICSFMWADNYWVLVAQEGSADQMVKELMGEVGRWDMKRR